MRDVPSSNAKHGVPEKLELPLDGGSVRRTEAQASSLGLSVMTLRKVASHGSDSAIESAI